MRAWWHGQPPQVEVYPDNHAAVQLFLACLTQWRRCAMTGRIIGLDYPAVRIVAEWLAMTLTPDLLSRLQVLEHDTIRLSHADAR